MPELRLKNRILSYLIENYRLIFYTKRQQNLVNCDRWLGLKISVRPALSTLISLSMMLFLFLYRSLDVVIVVSIFENDFA
jgi:hypothetical protein